MKVKDLIEKLLELDQETMVVVHGYEGGYCEVNEPTEVELVLNVNSEWFYGPHEMFDEDDHKNIKPTKAILL